MYKSLITNLIALCVLLLGMLPHPYQALCFTAGAFALSGALTNWLAVHMLFERVPLLYGSGIIPNRFEEFKTAIRQLIIREFFNREHIERFFIHEMASLSPEQLCDKVNYDQLFDGLVDAITQSSLGSMLSLVGGAGALEPLREPVKEKLQSIVKDLAAQHSGTDDGHTLIDTLTQKVTTIIDTRLDELSPEQVKQIVQHMIRRHLGWLVVWGGVFGGLIGVIVALYQGAGGA